MFTQKPTYKSKSYPMKNYIEKFIDTKIFLCYFKIVFNRASQLIINLKCN